MADPSEWASLLLYILVAPVAYITVAYRALGYLSHMHQPTRLYCALLAIIACFPINGLLHGYLGEDFTQGWIILLCIVAVTKFLNAKHPEIKLADFFSRLGWSRLIWGGLLLGNAGAFIFLTLTSPVFGWDAIDFWAKQAFVDIAANTDDPVKFSAPTTDRHPVTLVKILSHTAQLAPNATVTYSMFPWVIIGLTLPMITGTLAYLHLGSWAAAIVTAYISSSIPLVVNHVGISGYADIWQATTFTYAVGLLTIQRELPNKLFLALLVASLCLLSSFKNTGLPLASLIAWSALLGYLPAQQKRALALFSAAVMAFAFLSALIMPQYLSLTEPLGAGVNIMGREVVFANNGVHLLLASLKKAFIEDLSFFFIAPASVFFLSYALFSSKTATARIDVLTTLLPSLGFLLLLCSTLLATEYGKLYFVPHNNTGLSRFSMTWILGSLPVLVLAAKVIHINNRH